MRPQVNIIQNQSEEINPANIDSWEAEQLLRKYGHKPEQFSTNIQQPVTQPTNDLTFEEMIAQQEALEKAEQERRNHQMNAPKPITFNSAGYESEVKYTSDSDTGFGFKIEISTDMHIPRY